MSRFDQQKHRRVLIASSHPLFGQGLRSLLQERQQTGVEVVGMVAKPRRGAPGAGPAEP